MKNLLCFIIALISCFALSAQQLDLEKIMQGYDWVGHSPNNVRWSLDGKLIYFNWNPKNLESDSLYRYHISDGTLEAVPWQERQHLYLGNPTLSKDYKSGVYTKHGDVYLVDTQSEKVTRVTNTLDIASNAGFSHDGTQITYLSLALPGKSQILKKDANQQKRKLRIVISGCKKTNCGGFKYWHRNTVKIL